MNAVDVLLNNSFSSFRVEGKLEIKCLGPNYTSDYPFSSESGTTTSCVSVRLVPKDSVLKCYLLFIELQFALLFLIVFYLRINQ